MSGAAGQLLRHAAEEDAAEQEADLRGDRGQAQGSGESTSIHTPQPLHVLPQEDILKTG